MQKFVKLNTIGFLLVFVVVLAFKVQASEHIDIQVWTMDKIAKLLEPSQAEQERTFSPEKSTIDSISRLVKNKVSGISVNNPDEFQKQLSLMFKNRNLVVIPTVGFESGDRDYRICPMNYQSELAKKSTKIKASLEHQKHMDLFAKVENNCKPWLGYKKLNEINSINECASKVFNLTRAYGVDGPSATKGILQIKSVLAKMRELEKINLAKDNGCPLVKLEKNVSVGIGKNSAGEFYIVDVNMSAIVRYKDDVESKLGETKGYILNNQAFAFQDDFSSCKFDNEKFCSGSDMLNIKCLALRIPILNPTCKSHVLALQDFEKEMVNKIGSTQSISINFTSNLNLNRVNAGGSIVDREHELDRVNQRNRASQ